MSYMSYAAIVL